MRDEANSEANSATRLTTRVPWTVVEVNAMAGHRLNVRFADGTAGEVDVSEFIFADDAGVFVRLRDDDAFAQVRVVDGVVSWPGDLDLAPDAMYDAIVATGRWLVR